MSNSLLVNNFCVSLVNETQKNIFSSYIIESTFHCSVCSVNDSKGQIYFIKDKRITLCRKCSFKLQGVIKEFFSTHNDIFFEDIFSIRTIGTNEMEITLETPIELSIYNKKIQMTKSQLKTFYDQLSSNNKYYFENHLLPIENISSYQTEIIKNWRKKIKAINPDFDDFFKLSLAQRGMQVATGMINLHLKAKESVKKFFIIDKEKYESYPSVYFLSFCCIPNFKCSIKSHKSINAVFNIITNITDGFAYSFCPDCLYDFGYVLKEVYLNPNINEVQKGFFKITRIENDGYCFFDGRSDSIIYRINIENKFLDVNFNYLEKMAIVVLSSAAYKELFRHEYLKYRNEYIKRNKLIKAKKRLVNNAKFEREKELAKLEVKKKCDEEKEIAKLEIKKKCDEENNFKQTISNKALLEIFNKKVLICQKSKKGQKNLGYRKNKAEEYGFDGFKTIYIEGIDCHTLKHISPKQSDIIFYLDRPDDQLYLSFSKEDLRMLRGALLNTNENNPYYINNYKNFEIRRISGFFDNDFCYFCGNKNGPKYFTKFGYVAFSFCDDCKKKIIKQIDDVLENNLVVN